MHLNEIPAAAFKTIPPEATAARVAEIIASLLRLRTVSATGDFFALGGNSLLSAQLAFQIQREYRVDLSVKDIFEAKTLERITALIHARMDGGEALPAGISVAAIPSERQAARPELPDGAPITAQQRSIWLLEQSPASRGLSNVAIVLSHQGPIDGARLETCVRELVDRHPALRTTFAKQGPTVIQRPKKFVAVSRRQIDLSELPEAERTAALEEIKVEEIARPFDLERDAMVRLTEIRLAPDRGMLLFLFHHIAVDDRSLEIFFDQLQALYAAEDPSAIARSERSFLDYAVEDADAEASGDRADSVQFWHAQLRGMRGTAYPTRAGAPPERTFAGRHFYHALPSRLSDAIDAAAARHSTTPFCIFAAGMVYLFYRATGDDICVASLMSRRDRFTDDDVIGCFVNTVPLRTRVRPGGSLAELMEGVVATFVDAYAHRHVSFEDMMEGADVSEGSRGRALPVTINLEAEKVEEFTLGDARLRREPLDRGLSKRDLTLSLRKVDGQYRILVEYRSGLYATEEVGLLAQNLEAALEHLVFDPEARVDARLLAPPRTLPTVLEGLGWSRPADGAPAMPVHLLFRSAKEGRENKIAVMGADATITYGALDAQSDALASALAARGVKAGDLVAVLQSRRVETIVALLGIWKAGAGYAVIDASEPAPSLERIVSACRPVLVLGSRRALDGLPLTLAALAVEDACLAPISRAVAEQAARVDPQATAYVCFTSGTSGTPKGVAVSHASINRVIRNPSYLTISPDDVFLSISPLGFDGSIFEIWAPLVNGATLRLLDDGAFSLDAVADALEQAHVSVLFVTTQLFNALVDRRLDALRTVPAILFGGEKASREHAERLLAAGYAGNLRNMYGPTETTVFATSHALSRDGLGRHQGAIPIGRAHNDTSVVVLDEHLAPMPCGVAGEIVIGGPGVAKGYINDAALTAVRFIDLALPGNADARFYRSGDFGYFDADGEVHFLGRRDRQVKVSGYRIELDELESIIGRVSGVSGCHCLADDGLVAFVGHDDARVSAEEIKARVRAALPAYKVPACFVFAPQLPLNANGKVDVAALDRLCRQPGEAAGPLPRPDLAQIIREVWSGELQSDSFGDDDNFFDVGGTSLKIMLVHDELTKRLRQQGLAQEIEITHLFEFTTVASLAEFLEGLRHGP